MVKYQGLQAAVAVTDEMGEYTCPLPALAATHPNITVQQYGILIGIVQHSATCIRAEQSTSTAHHGTQHSNVPQYTANAQCCTTQHMVQHSTAYGTASNSIIAKHSMLLAISTEQGAKSTQPQHVQ